MKQSKATGESESTAATECVAALVVRLDYEHGWPELKRRVEELGGSIIYQKAGPPWQRLLIVPEERER